MFYSNQRTSPVHSRTLFTAVVHSIHIVHPQFIPVNHPFHQCIIKSLFLWCTFHGHFQFVVHLSIWSPCYTTVYRSLYCPWSALVYNPVQFVVHTNLIVGPLQFTFHGLWFAIHSPRSNPQSTPVHGAIHPVNFRLFHPKPSPLSVLIHGPLQITLVQSWPLHKTNSTHTSSLAYTVLLMLFYFSGSRSKIAY